MRPAQASDLAFNALLRVRLLLHAHLLQQRAGPAAGAAALRSPHLALSSRCMVQANHNAPELRRSNNSSKREDPHSSVGSHGRLLSATREELAAARNSTERIRSLETVSTSPDENELILLLKVRASSGKLHCHVHIAAPAACVS